MVGKVKLIQYEFIAWLNRHARETVGQTLSKWHCPIAEYIIAQGCKDVVVFDDQVFYISEQQRHNDTMPDWARQFVHYIDIGSVRQTTVSGDDCLELLGQLNLL